MLTAIDLSPACGAAPTGIGRYVSDLCAALAERDAAPLGVYRGHRGPPAQELIRSCHASHRYDWLGGRLGFRFRLPGLLRRHGASVFHVTTTLGSPHGLPCPVVATIHDVYPALPDAAVPDRHRRQFNASLRALLMVCRSIICPTRAAADDLRRLTGTRLPIRVIPHGIRPQAPPARSPGSAYVLTVGAIEARKGYHLLAECWRSVRGELPWVHIGPVRHDPGGAIRDAMTKAGCRVLGYVDETARRSWLAGAAVLLQPSLHEGYGYAPFEAMALGVPVLARPIPAARELLADAVMWNDDDRRWSDAAAILASRGPMRDRCIAAGHDLVARYTLDGMAQAHLDAYREACT